MVIPLKTFRIITANIHDIFFSKFCIHLEFHGAASLFSYYIDVQGHEFPFFSRYHNLYVIFFGLLALDVGLERVMRKMGPGLFRDHILKLSIFHTLLHATSCCHMVQLVPQVRWNMSSFTASLPSRQFLLMNVLSAVHRSFAPPIDRISQVFSSVPTRSKAFLIGLLGCNDSCTPTPQNCSESSKVFATQTIQDRARKSALSALTLPGARDVL
jgi:hypothetical protein